MSELNQQLGDMFSIDYATYIISSSMDLGGLTHKLGQNSVIVFKEGGQITNGTLVGNHTVIIGQPHITAEMEGTFSLVGDVIPPKGRFLGDLFYYILQDKIIFWNGVQWKDFSGHDADIPHFGDTYPTIEEGTNEGFMFYNTVTDKYSIWDGTKWNDFDGYDPTLRRIGTTAQRPSVTANTNIGFQYYDTTLKKYVIWDGTRWLDSDSYYATLPHSGSSRPTIASGTNIGFTFLDTTNDKYYVWTGSSWLELSVGSMTDDTSLVIAAAFAYVDEKVNSLQKSIEDGLPRIKTQELFVARKMEGYPKDGNFYLHGAGVPSMVPQFNGQEYYDETNNVWYKAGFITTNPTTAAWKQITN